MDTSFAAAAWTPALLLSIPQANRIVTCVSSVIGSKMGLHHSLLINFLMLLGRLPDGLDCRFGTGSQWTGSCG